MNVTLSIDDRLVARVRKKAEVLGKSLNQLIRDYLKEARGRRGARREHRGVEAAVRSRELRGWRFDRDELHDRPSFFDTNVLVYTDDKSSPAKQSAAMELLAVHRRASTGVLSFQVL